MGNVVSENVRNPRWPPDARTLSHLSLAVGFLALLGAVLVGIVALEYQFVLAYSETEASAVDDPDINEVADFEEFSPEDREIIRSAIEEGTRFTFKTRGEQPGYNVWGRLLVRHQGNYYVFDRGITFVFDLEGLAAVGLAVLGVVGLVASVWLE
jgi:hypothetical protein